MKKASRQLCVGLLWLALCALGPVICPAGAAARTFGSYGAGAGRLKEPNGIAVDRRSGDLYVVDSNNERIDKFTADGTFLLAWGWGVLDGRTQRLQICTSATACHTGLTAPPGVQGLDRLSGAGELRFTEGVVVDNDPRSRSHGDVYVVDITDHRVEKFSATGKFLLEFGGAVNETAHGRGEIAGEDVCPLRPGDRCTTGLAGPAPGRFEFPVEGNFIAVGPAGTVYVGDRNRVQEFSSGGLFELELTLAPKPPGEGREVGGVSRLAVDSSGDMYVVRIGVSGVRKYSPQGQLLQTLDEEGGLQGDEGPTPGIALDPSGRQIFLDFYEHGQHRVLEYDSSGVELPSFDAGMEDGLHGMAYGSGKLYLLYTNGNTSPPTARVRIVTPPQVASPVFSSFRVLGWLLGRP